MRSVQKRSLAVPIEADPLHRFLASSGHAQFILVTTQDTALEQAFDDVGAEYDVVVHQDLRDSSGTVLWWPHGLLNLSPLVLLI
jgi:hypothetical protein